MSTFTLEMGTERGTPAGSVNSSVAALVSQLPVTVPPASQLHDAEIVTDTPCGAIIPRFVNVAVP